MNRPRVSVRQMMAAVAVIGAILGVGRMSFHHLVRHTTYAPDLRLDRFDDRLVGISRARVSAIHGAPLRIYVYDSRTAVQDQADTRFSGGSRQDTEQIRGRTVPKTVFQSYLWSKYETSEHWEYSVRTGGSSYRRLVVSFDLVSGKVESVGDRAFEQVPEDKLHVALAQGRVAGLPGKDDHDPRRTAFRDVGPGALPGPYLLPRRPDRPGRPNPRRGGMEDPDNPQGASEQFNEANWDRTERSHS